MACLGRKIGDMTQSTRLKIHIIGIVQEVGFWPFVYGLATRLH
jgi:hypothetical protein